MIYIIIAQVAALAFMAYRLVGSRNRLKTAESDIKKIQLNGWYQRGEQVTKKKAQIENAPESELAPQAQGLKEDEPCPARKAGRHVFLRDSPVCSHCYGIKGQ